MSDRIPFSTFAIGNFVMKNDGSSTTNLVNGMLSSNYETNLWKALQDFNTDYYTYLGNCNPCPPENIISSDGVTVCNKNCYGSKTCNDAKDLLVKESAHLNSYITYGGYNTASIFRQYGNTVLPAQESINFNSVRGNIIGNVYPSLLNTRADLDKKLRDLYEIDGSLSLDQQNRFDGTIYSGILLTVLASALVYYTFTKL